MKTFKARKVHKKRGHVRHVRYAKSERTLGT